MVTAMTAICRDVQQVSIFESADVSVYESAGNVAGAWLLASRGVTRSAGDGQDVA